MSARPDALEVSNRALVLYAIARRGAIELFVNETGGDPLRLRQAETARKEQDRWLSAHELTASLSDVEATLLAGEISMAAAIASGEFVAAHEKYGRNRPAAAEGADR